MNATLKAQIYNLYQALVLKSENKENLLVSATAAKMVGFIKWIATSKTRSELKSKMNQVINHLKKYRNTEAKELSSKLTVLYGLV